MVDGSGARWHLSGGVRGATHDDDPVWDVSGVPSRKLAALAAGGPGRSQAVTGKPSSGSSASSFEEVLCGALA